MVQDPRLQEIFPVPPLVAYRKPKNIRDKLIRAKVPPPNIARPKRNTTGMKKCNRCGVCPFVKERKIIQATATNYKMNISISGDCSSSNIIYLLGCRKCPQQYIGETERTLKERFFEHKGYVNTNNQSKATGVHFNTKGHSVSDMQITIVEKIFSKDLMFRNSTQDTRV